MPVVLEELKARLDVKTEHAAFVADFSGSNDRAWQSEVIRFVAKTDPAMLFGISATEDWCEQRLLLSKLCGNLLLESGAASLADVVAHGLDQEGAGFYGGDGVPLLEAAIAIADLNSSLPPETKAADGAALLTAVHRVSDSSFGFGQFPIP